jgi:hypothetical protein
VRNRKGCCLGLPAAEHLSLARLAAGHAAEMGRQAMATARAGQCNTAFDKYQALVWWSAAAICHADSTGAHKEPPNKFMDRVHREIESNCLRPPRMRR